MKNSIKSISAIALIALVGSCSSNKFSGNTAPMKKPVAATSNVDASKDASKDAVDANGNPMSTVAGGGSIDGCGSGGMVEDANATFQFNSRSEVTTFVNSLNGYSKVPIKPSLLGEVHADTITAAAVCRLKGYVGSEKMTSKGFYSCGDNTHGYWNDSLKDFEVKPACSDNSSIVTLICKGKLLDPCITDKSWIFVK